MAHPAPETTTVGTARGRARREQLLNAAAALVAERGFHSVGIADIGAAAGVTGSAIYRHFRNKDEMLVALIDRVVDPLLAGARDVVRDAPSAEAALEALVRAHAAFAVRERTIIAVYDQEAVNLPPDDRRHLRRSQRLYANIWHDVVAELRPDLVDQAVKATVHGAFGLLNSVADFEARLSDEDLREVLVAFTLAGILPSRARG